MDDAKVLNTGINDLNFLYNKISVPKMSMVYWMKIPEFVSSMNDMLQLGKTIDDRAVYEIMVSIYEAALPLKGTDAGRVYNYAKLRQGIKHLSEALSEN